jgi:hypothetical protein
MGAAFSHVFARRAFPKFYEFFVEKSYRALAQAAVSFSIPRQQKQITKGGNAYGKREQEH